MPIFKCETIALSDVSDVAQVIIAIANLSLAGYIFFYQIKKDRSTELATAILNEQNIRLQWFKELIVQPNINHIDSFYRKLYGVQSQINGTEISSERKQVISRIAKAEASNIRKQFIDTIQQIDKVFAEKLQNNIDDLIDSIIEAIFNPEITLNDPEAYEKYINSKITYSRNSLIALLYNYNGLAK